MSDESLNEAEVTETPTEDVKTEPEVVEETEAQEESETGKDDKPEPEEKKEPTEAEKVRHAMQKRIDRKTAIEKQQQEQIEELRQKIESLTPQEVDTTPKEEDFNTFEEWQDAVVEHKANERLKAKELELQQKRLAEKQAEANRAMSKRFEEAEIAFKAEHPEYDDNAVKFMEVADDIQRSKGNNPTIQAIGQVLREVDGAPALINHLGQNEDLAYEIAELSPVNAAFKLFELKQSLVRSSEPEKAKPAPVKALKGTGKPSKAVKDLDAKGVLNWVNN